jgi:hypothetical protein
MFRKTRSIVAALAVGALAGCAAGPMPGSLTLPGKTPEPVTLNYESSLFGGSGTLSTLLPSGERFKGKYVLTPYAPDHHMTGTLAGDRGGSMTCRFKLNEPGIGPDKGGTGRCEIAEGGLIDTQF